MDGEQSNLYSNPHHDPLASTDTVQRTELPYWNPSAPEPYQPVMPQPINYRGGGYMDGQTFPPVGRYGPATPDFLLNLIFVGIFWEVWVCLYPFAAGVAVFSLFYVTGLARLFVPPALGMSRDLTASLIGIVTSVVLLWVTSRTEHRMADSNFYRIPRHLVRLVLLGLLSVLAFQHFVQGVPWQMAYAAPSFSRLLGEPKALGLFLGTILVGHFFLWNFTLARSFWHRRLVGARLRAPSA